MKKIIIIFITLVLYSCNTSLDDKITGKWNFESVNSEILDDSSYRYKNSNLSLSSLLGSSFFETNFLFFKKEKKLTAAFGAYSGVFIEGKWSLNEKDSVLSITENRITKPFIKILALSNKELRFSLIHTDKMITEDMEFVFAKEDQELINSKFDYTQKQYNNWRKRPYEPEDLEAISKRVKQCLEYSVAYLKYNLEQKNESVSLKELSFLPIDFYDNGIQLKDSEKIPKWENVFFSKVDALNGYEIIRQVITNDFSLPEGKSGLELNIYILEEIKNRIK